MTKKRTSAVLGLYISERREHGYYHLYGSAVWVGRTPSELHEIDSGALAGTVPYVSPDRVRHVGDWGDRSALGGLDLESLRITSQGNDNDAERHLYGWEVEYRDVYAIDGPRAKRMHQTLTAIDRTMEKLRAQYGRPASFGAYVLRVAAAIGATRIVIDGQASRRFRSETTHRIMDLEGGASTVDGIVREWAKPAEQPAQAQLTAGEEAAS